MVDSNVLMENSVETFSFFPKKFNPLFPLAHIIIYDTVYL